MPHCVIECSSTLSDLVSLESLVTAIQDTTESSELFAKGDVKTRLRQYDYYSVAGEKTDFVHLVSHILSGRTVEQRKKYSINLAASLCELLPTVKMLSVEVREIDRAIYSNRKSVEEDRGK